jgi:peptide/nickel transport system permease protein
VAVNEIAVSEVIGDRFGASLALMAIAWLLSGFFGVILGILAEAKEGSLLDRSLPWGRFNYNPN